MQRPKIYWLPANPVPPMRGNQPARVAWLIVPMLFEPFGFYQKQMAKVTSCKAT